MNVLRRGFRLHFVAVALQARRSLQGGPSNAEASFKAAAFDRPPGHRSVYRPITTRNLNLEFFTVISREFMTLRSAKVPTQSSRAGSPPSAKSLCGFCT